MHIMFGKKIYILINMKKFLTSKVYLTTSL